jgi:hypothetical protein
LVHALLLIAALAQAKPVAKEPAGAPEKGLTAKAVLATIEARKDEVKGCREENLTARGRNESEAGGTVKLRWVIGQDGRTSQVDVVEKGSTLGDSILRLCLVKAVRRWSFPASDISTTIEYPFEFPSVAAAYADERVLRGSSGTVVPCIAAARARLPTQLVVVARFRIGDRGEPQQVDVETTPAVHDEGLRGCVIRAVRGWRFDAVAFGRSDGVVSATWTLTGVGILDIQGFHPFGRSRR